MIDKLQVSEPIETILKKMVDAGIFACVDEGFDFTREFREFATRFIDRERPMTQNTTGKITTEKDAIARIVTSFLGLIDSKDLDNFSTTILGRNRIVHDIMKSKEANGSSV